MIFTLVFLSFFSLVLILNHHHLFVGFYFLYFGINGDHKFFVSSVIKSILLLKIVSCSCPDAPVLYFFLSFPSCFALLSFINFVVNVSVYVSPEPMPRSRKPEAVRVSLRQKQLLQRSRSTNYSERVRRLVDRLSWLTVLYLPWGKVNDLLWYMLIFKKWSKLTNLKALMALGNCEHD